VCACVRVRVCVYVHSTQARSWHGPPIKKKTTKTKSSQKKTIIAALKARGNVFVFFFIIKNDYQQNQNVFVFREVLLPVSIHTGIHRSSS
jgi:hypothetical protein